MPSPSLGTALRQRELTHEQLTHRAGSALTNGKGANAKAGPCLAFSSTFWGAFAQPSKRPPPFPCCRVRALRGSSSTGGSSEGSTSRRGRIQLEDGRSNYWTRKHMANALDREDVLGRAQHHMRSFACRCARTPRDVRRRRHTHTLSHTGQMQASAGACAAQLVDAGRLSHAACTTCILSHAACTTCILHHAACTTCNPLHSARTTCTPQARCRRPRRRAPRSWWMRGA